MREPALSFLHSIRSFELQRIIAEFPKCGRVLEIGAGSGHQALELQRAGYEVLAVDLASSDYSNSRVFPVIDYDGANLPVEKGSIDVVFTSNVLEHIEDLRTTLNETRRVLAPGGLAVHVLPTPSWRLWTILTHYPWLTKRVFETLLFRDHLTPAQLRSRAPAATRATGLKPYLSMLYPTRHGERGTTLTELFYFSRRWWTTTFQDNGFLVEKTFPIGLFYTGSMLVAHRLPITIRSSLGRWLGAACMAYVLRPIEPTRSRSVLSRATWA